MAPLHKRQCQPRKRSFVKAGIRARSKACTRSPPRALQSRNPNNQGALAPSSVQRLPGRYLQRIVRVPQSHDDIRVERRCHSSSCPRSSRSHVCMAFRPFPIPGLPIPIYFAKGLSFRTAFTCTPFPLSSNSSLSPARTPNRRRISRGTVISPLLVNFACLFMACSHSLLYRSAPYSYVLSGSKR